MRRTALLLATMVVAMLLVCGVALAANHIECSDQDGALCVGTLQPDEMEGTNSRDEIRALAGKDVVRARDGNDLVYGQLGDDRLYAGQCDKDQMFGGLGGDIISVSDSQCIFAHEVGAPAVAADTVECGVGFDVVRGVDDYDRVASDCERVVRE